MTKIQKTKGETNTEHAPHGPSVAVPTVPAASATRSHRKKSVSGRRGVSDESAKKNKAVDKDKLYHFHEKISAADGTARKNRLVRAENVSNLTDGARVEVDALLGRAMARTKRETEDKASKKIANDTGVHIATKAEQGSPGEER